MFKIPKFKQISSKHSIDKSMKNIFKQPSFDKISKSKQSYSDGFSDLRTTGTQHNPIINNIDLINFKKHNKIYPFNNYDTHIVKEEYVKDKKSKNNKPIGYADGKPIIKLSNGIYPSVGTLNNIYKKIPDDRKVPVVLESRKKYLEEYTANQEKLKGIKFTNEEKERYMKEELPKLAPVTARFTTYHNKWIPARVVIFPGSKGKKETEANVLHEYGHELKEKNSKLNKEWNSKIKCKTSPTLYGTTEKDEDFAESYVLYKNPKLIPISNPKTNKQEIEKRFNIIGKYSVEKDRSKNMSTLGRLADKALYNRYYNPQYKKQQPYGSSEVINNIALELKNYHESGEEGLIPITNEQGNTQWILNSSDLTKQKLRDEINYRKQYKKDLTLLQNDLEKDNSPNYIGDYNVADDTYKQNYLMTEAYTGDKIFGNIDTTDDSKLDDMETLQSYKNQLFENKMQSNISDDTFSGNNVQTLFHAGNISPSEHLKSGKPLYGFSNLNYARGWQTKHNYPKVWQFSTNNYDLDTHSYIRPTVSGKQISDNEFVVGNVIGEDVVSGNKQNLTIQPCTFCKNNTKHYKNICMECYKVE